MISTFMNQRSNEQCAAMQSLDAVALKMQVQTKSCTCEPFGSKHFAIRLNVTCVA